MVSKTSHLPKNVKAIMLEEIWGDLESKNATRDSLESFLLHFMFLLTDKLAQNSHI